MRYTFSFILLLFSCSTFSQAPDGYYDGTEGLSRLPLKHQLHLISKQQSISWNYSHLPLFYESTDRDLFYENDSSMLDIYSENPTGLDPYNYYYEDTSLMSGASDEGLGWNREHIVSQSFFFSNYPMYSDLHFVVPTDARVNQRRSNVPFGTVNSTPAFTSLNGSKVGLSVSPGYTLSVFEPIDEFKGDVARMLLYAATRYETLLPYFDTANTRNPFEGRGEIGVRKWLLNQLIAWHIADPVSEKEVYRNNEVYQIQGNRNPFIDHPEWVGLIWDAYEDVHAPNAPIYLETTAKGAKFLQVKWEHTGEIDVMGYEVYINDSMAGRTQEHFFSFHSLTPDSTYTIRLLAYDGKYNKSSLSLTLTSHTLTADTFAKNLQISKVIVGSGNNKAIEIVNNTGYTVDLRNYSLSKRAYNASAEAYYWNGSAYQMDGYLEHGKKIVLVHPEWELECFDKEAADFVTAAPPLLFDGTLAIRLNFNNKSIDLIGRSSEMLPFATDVSMYRKESKKHPSTTYHSEEWIFHPLDYCENLGNPADTPSSILPHSNEIKIEIYPNPIAPGNQLYITGINLHKIKCATLTDVKGTEVYRKTDPFRSVNHLTIPKVAKGIYILTMDGQSTRILIE